MKHHGKITIPLTRPDFSKEDKREFLKQIGSNNLADDNLVKQWESAWEDIWQRGCVAFADPNELILNLKNILGLQPGCQIYCSPLLHPIWKEALLNCWLNPNIQNVLSATGQERWNDKNFQSVAQPAGQKINRLVQHNFGIPATMDSGFEKTVEDISAILKPINPEQGFTSKAQLLLLDGNRMVQGGATCLLLSKDNELVCAMRKDRLKAPAAAICSVGLSQLKRLDDLIECREKLAKRYLELYTKNSITLPPSPVGGRRWESFIIQLTNQTKQQELQLFLNKAGIAAAPPIWYHLPDVEDDQPLSKLQKQSLAIPLYASLSKEEQKKIINRIHRWVERDKGST
ncbi:MAG: DegT/DnrJ/EryC1/StrS family aminotransferase [Magnetococcales bacterium]|nr:DegT/DnrJ/EryC1/StrS family aminotransferase [Magnetococcales bacterium]